MKELKTQLPGLTLAKPDPERDGLFALNWFTSPGGKETLLSMGNPENKIKIPTFKEEKDRLHLFLELEETGKRVTWMVRMDNKTIGAAWIDLEEQGTVKAPSIHLMIGDIYYRGKGIGTAVMNFMIDYCRSVLKSDYVYSRNLVSNQDITYVKKSIGLTKDGEPYADKSGLVWQNTKMAL